MENLLEVQDSIDDRDTEIQILDSEPYNIYETDGVFSGGFCAISKSRMEIDS